MGSTNKTANIGLSQFIGTDKPTWLVDYNNDMAVIDEAIGELQNDSGLTDTAIAELQTNVQNLQNGQGDSATEIAEVKSNVQTLSANYETMHHEVVLLNDSVNTVNEKYEATNEKVADIEEFIAHTTYTAVHINANTGNDDNDGLTVSTPMKTILNAYRKYHTGAVDFILGNGEYNLPSDLRACTSIILSIEENASPTVITSNVILANELFVKNYVTVVANNDVTVDVNNIVLGGTFLVNTGYTVNISDSHVTIGNSGKLTGDGKISLNRSFVVYSSANTVIDVATLIYASSMVMDKGVTVSSTVTNSRSVIASELTV